MLNGALAMWPNTLASSLLLGSAYAVPYSEYILAPSSRTVNPVSIYNVNGTVDNAEGLLNGVNGTAAFSPASAVTFDFGKNIAGQVSVVVPAAGASSTSSAAPDAVIWLTFTESSMWISGNGSDATASDGVDEPMYVC